MTTSSRSSNAPPRPRKVVGRYELVRQIGEGGMGTVFSAVHTELGTVAAVKRMRLRPGDPPDRVPWVGKMFKKEARVTALLQELIRKAGKLDCIARVLDAGVTEGDPGIPYMVMDLLDGMTIAQFIDRFEKQRENVPFTHVISLAYELAVRIQVIHSFGVVHCDIKPENVIACLRTRNGVAVNDLMIMDFGMCKVLIPLCDGWEDDDITGSTPRYGAPEQALCQTITYASDVYALGMFFFELATGRFPWDTIEEPLTSEQLKIASVYWPVPPVSEFRRRQDLPDWFDRLVLRMLSKDATKRPSMAEILELLEAGVAELKLGTFDPVGAIRNTAETADPPLPPIVPSGAADNDELPHGDDGEFLNVSERRKQASGRSAERNFDRVPLPNVLLAAAKLGLSLDNVSTTAVTSEMPWDVMRSLTGKAANETIVIRRARGESAVATNTPLTEAQRSPPQAVTSVTGTAAIENAAGAPPLRAMPSIVIAPPATPDDHPPVAEATHSRPYSPSGDHRDTAVGHVAARENASLDGARRVARASVPPAPLTASSDLNRDRRAIPSSAEPTQGARYRSDGSRNSVVVPTASGGVDPGAPTSAPNSVACSPDAVTLPPHDAALSGARDSSVASGTSTPSLRSLRGGPNERPGTDPSPPGFARGPSETESKSLPSRPDKRSPHASSEDGAKRYESSYDELSRWRARVKNDLDDFSDDDVYSEPLCPELHYEREPHVKPNAADWGEFIPPPIEPRLKKGGRATVSSTGGTVSSVPDPTLSRLPPRARRAAVWASAFGAVGVLVTYIVVQRLYPDAVPGLGPIGGTLASRIVRTSSDGALASPAASNTATATTSRPAVQLAGQPSPQRPALSTEGGRQTVLDAARPIPALPTAIPRIQQAHVSAPPSESSRRDAAILPTTSYE